MEYFEEKMKISTEIGSVCGHMNYEKAVESVAKAGFDAFDLSMFEMASYDWKNHCVIENHSFFRGPEYLKAVRRLKQIGLDYGIVCNQSHAPFPVSDPEVRSYLKRAIECTAEAGGQICVIHPDNNKNAQENAEMYLELLLFAKEHGVKIATENMWNWDDEEGHAAPAACSSHEDFLAHIMVVNDPDFVACLDIGHAEMRGLHTSAEQMVLTLGSHLQALHIHDNDLLNDNHQIPFSMKIDFERVLKALKKINYKGYFTLEADAYLRGVSDAETSAGLRNLALAARKLADRYEELS